MKFLSAFSHKALALSLALSLPAATWAGVARAPAAPAAAAAPIAPTAILSAHHQVFTSPGSLQPLFQQWSAERTQASLPDAERLARELILRAASAPSLAAAGRAIFSAPLAPAPQQMAAEIVLQVRGEMRSNPTLRKAVERAAAELWKGGSASQTDEAIAKAGAFRDLERVLEAWKPKQDGLERIGALAPAALAWREAYAGEPGVRGALLPADWDAAGSGGGSAEAGGGRGWSGKRGFAKGGAAASEAAGGSVSMADVLLGVFDADDNLWVNVNAVWVFKKGSGSKAQERIPTEEFAEVRGDIGKRGKYKDYEYWDDPKKGSFREFLDPEDGTNPLLENLKKAVRERPLADIFGDSWDAFAYLLSVNPKGVHILTASGVSREQFLEALAWLKAQGLIPDAPPIENIQCVGNPKHPFYAGSASPSLAKLKVVKPILDRQQALAKQLGRRAPRLLTPAGDGFAHLLPFGFSDDDKGNFTTMRDGVPGEKGLAEEFKAGRWPDLKLTLFYTDRDDPESGAFVIAPDGKPRDVSADEYGETFMKGNSQEADVRPKKGPKKNPRPATRRVNVADVDALIDKVYFSVDAPGVEDEKVETNVDLIALDADALREFLERKVPAGWKKAFYAERYTADDPHIQAVLESAERYGDVDGTLVLPLDTAMDVDFKDGETSTTDLRRARPKDTDGGRLVAGIMGHGWKVNDRKARLKLVTPPLYNHGDEDRDPLMHKKRLITVLTGPNGEKIYHCKSGTGNWSTRNQRVNMVVETHHPAIVEHELAELQASVDAFMDWKPIKAIQAVQPRRILTNNGETLLLASTAGQYNTNHLFLDAIAKTVDDPANYKLLDADLYHFVMTLSAGMKLIKDALEKHPEAWLNLVADMKFAPQRGWGEAANTGGFLVLKPFQPSFPWPGRIRNRVKGYIYQRAIEGAVQRDLEGPPTATFVYHLKLSLARILERGEEWQYISLGSLNFSNNYHNAEFQWLWRLKPTSRWHRVMRGLALGHAEAHPEWAVPVWRAPLRDTAARLIGHAQTQVPVAEMRPLEQAAKEKRLSELGLRLMRLLAEGTTLVRDTFPPDTARRNILRFLDIVGLYGDFEKLLAGVLSPLSIPRTANAALPLAYKEHSAYDIRTALRSLLWEPSIDRAKLERMVDAIWKAVGLDEHLAEMQRLREKEKEEKEKAAAKRAAGEAASAAGEE